ncbi:peripheral-type benzodiazepine receptor [Phakopsora pachyrhizi]|uniref:Peripheral-type benzodiazepine receptor n=1 Tax=Phakopsora pachyrhizi TaxID=170000 RepID=A0AAV0AIY6_PHAPC|nr:peripheral-type benzodiazepine receptor [Phakopsora pachyrhizi]KAI8451021.1 peripheral-type benzodiazepine receptor [Phakopsora pachyrhizi]CAH7667778.1 peripheral-type benzodiazepine receptor [Phakopsora pachyrhizi]
MVLKNRIPVSLLGISSDLTFSILTPLTIGSLTGLITKSSVNDWYPDLRKPKLNPPRWLFPIAWTYLYVSMGLGSHLIYRTLLNGTSSLEMIQIAEKVLRLYYIQLGLNFIWTPLFFGLRRPDLALLDIIGLTGTVLTMTNLSRRVNTKVTYLFIPYALWVSYATYLNSGIWYLNGGSEKIKVLFNKIKGMCCTSCSKDQKDD